MPYQFNQFEQNHSSSGEGAASELQLSFSIFYADTVSTSTLENFDVDIIEISSKKFVIRNHRRWKKTGNSMICMLIHLMPKQ